MEATVTQKLSSRVLLTEPANWKEFRYIQQEDFKELPPEAKNKLRASILENNFTQPFYVWHCDAENINYCLDGRHRTRILEQLKSEGTEVPDMLPATFIYCRNKKEAAAMVLVYSSIYAKVTQQGLFDFIQSYELDYENLKMTVDLPGFDTMDFETMLKNTDGEDKTYIISSLQERFIIPPFSIFDSRQGYWQDRKKLWQSLGFNSQATREEVELIAKSGQSPAVYALRNEMRDLLGREPEWDEIIEQARKKGMHLYEGASTFDPVLCEICYKWFCPAGGSIIDPFAGGSVRGIVAGVLGFDYIGIDLRNDQVEENRNQWSKVSKTGMSGSAIGWISGDSNKVLDEIQENYDFIFSCPPYHDLEQYSDDPADLSNMDYGSFKTVYRSIIQKTIARLKENRFACFVVGDIRDENGFYRNFVSETIESFNESGALLYNEIILINVAGSLPIRVGRQFEGGRKVGKMHQNVLVFYKGDHRKIKDEFPKINMVEDLQQLNYQPNIAQSILDD